MNELKRLIRESAFYTPEAQKKRVEINAPSLEAGLEEAASMFKCEMHDLEYEIVEEGSEGLFGVGKKPYRIAFTYIPQSTGTLTAYGQLEEDFSFTVGSGSGKIEPKDQDARPELKVTREGVLLRIAPAKGKGKPLSDFEAVKQLLRQRELLNYDTDIVEQIFKKRKSEFTHIADWVPHMFNDGKVTVEVAPDEMRAFVTVTPPQKCGREMDELDVKETLTDHGVVHGIRQEAIPQIFNDAIFNRPFLIAEGTPAINGENGRVDFKVNIEKNNLPRVLDEDTNVDFKDLNLIENVTVGQTLAQLVPPTDATPGRTVRGGYIEARDGRPADIKSLVGSSVELSQDGTKIIASINGQVIYQLGKLRVEEVYVVKGDVGPQTGNITFLGNVIVNGNVMDNYKIDAAGNIDIKGTVGKASLEAKGDIYVKLGIRGRMESKDRDGEVQMKVTQDAFMIRVLPALGKGKPLTDTHTIEEMLKAKNIDNYDPDLIAKIVKEANGKFVKIAHAPGVDPNAPGIMRIGDYSGAEVSELEETIIKAGNDVIAKFIEYARVDAARDVIATESIVSSYVDAGRRVILVGKRATIMGGKTRALEDINAKVLGSTSGAKTEVQVGLLPRDRQRLDELKIEQSITEKELTDVNLYLKPLEAAAGAGKLDAERKATYDAKVKRQSVLIERSQRVATEIEDLKQRMIMNDQSAQISAAKTIFAGVIPTVKAAKFPGDGAVRDPLRAVTLYADGEIIQVRPYRGTPTQVRKAAV